MLGLAAALAPLPEMLARKGLLEDALAATDAVTLDTLSALCAFIVPGRDPYSRAQGDRTKTPGALEAGTVPLLIHTLDNFVSLPAPGSDDKPLPTSGAVATLLNDYALEVNPAAEHGVFLSPFARLDRKGKAAVFQKFEADPAWDDNQFRFVSGILPSFTIFLAYSEGGVLDPSTRHVRKRPIGWRLSRYSGPADGHPELRGYYHGHKHARGSGA